MATHIHDVPTPGNDISAFLASEDFALLAKPLVFEKTEAVNCYACCLAMLPCVLTGGITGLFLPVVTFCPSTLYKEYGLSVNSQSIKMTSAMNDCCCHLATTQKTVPLEKVQDVELVTNCCLSCFGLKLVRVQTAGQGSDGAEMEVAFLKHPDVTRNALQLAVRLWRERSGLAAPTAQAMARGGGLPMARRLSSLVTLVTTGVLSESQANELRVPILVATGDPLGQITEAADLAKSGAISPAEFERLKEAIIAQVVSACGK